MKESMPAVVARSESSHAQQSSEIHHTHRDVSGGWLRPAVFGAMDGLVSNTALVAGVAAADASTHNILLAGWAGLLAGAFSMAVGEWTSVQSQRELVESEINKERLELERSPAAEERELAGLFRRRGLPRDLANRVAAEVSKDPDEAWRVHVREELGIDPDSQPSAYLAGSLSLVTFGIGALAPLVPYLAGAHSLLWTLVLGGVLLFVMGGAVAQLTRRPLLRGAMRQFVLGAASVAVVIGVGHAIGTTVSG